MNRIQNEQSKIAVAGAVLFPSFYSVLVEYVVGLIVLGLTVFRDWNHAKSVSGSAVFDRLKTTFSTISDAVTSTKYGEVIISALLWLLVGMVVYVLLVKLITYVGSVWNVYDEKKNDIFPGWYNGTSFMSDTLVTGFRWVLRHVFAIMLLVFSLFFCLPLSLAYVHIGVKGDFMPLELVYALLTLLFATRLTGIAFCIMSRKVTAWYVD